MAGIKIVDLPALGRDLAATDLLELSLAGGTGSRKITGQEIINASKLNVGTTPIINGTAGRLLFQGTGDILQQSGNLFWDNAANQFIIGGSTASNVRANTNEFNIQRDGLTVPTNGNQLMFNLVGNGQGMSITNQNGTTYRIGQFSVSNVLTLGAAGNNTLNLFTSGNVGIGTTTDAGFKLDVNGTARIVNALTLGNVVLSLSSQGNGTISSSNSVGNPTTYITLSGPVYYNPTSGTAGTFAVAGQSYMNSGTAQFNTLTVAPIINNTGTYSGIFRGFYYNPTLTSVTGTTHRAIETTTGDVIFNGGNVGIGTSTPLRAIDVFASNPEIATRISGNGTGKFSFLGNAGGEIGAISLTGSSGEMRIFTASSYFPTFYSGGSEAMRIATTRNILINTTTDAGFRLDVNGTARVQGTTTLSDVVTCSQGLRVNGGWTTFNASTIFGSSAQSGNTFNFATQYVGGATGTTNYFNFSGTLASGTGGSFNVFNVQQTFSNTNSSQTFRGFYYNPNITGLQAGTAHWAIHTTSGRVRFEGLPTSPTGLNAGDIYNDGGILKIV